MGLWPAIRQQLRGLSVDCQQNLRRFLLSERTPNTARLDSHWRNWWRMGLSYQPKISPQIGQSYNRSLSSTFPRSVTSRGVQHRAWTRILPRAYYSSRTVFPPAPRPNPQNFQTDQGSLLQENLSREFQLNQWGQANNKNSSIHNYGRNERQIIDQRNLHSGHKSVTRPQNQQRQYANQVQPANQGFVGRQAQFEGQRIYEGNQNFGDLNVPISRPNQINGYNRPYPNNFQNRRPEPLTLTVPAENATQVCVEGIVKTVKVNIQKTGFLVAYVKANPGQLTSKQARGRNVFTMVAERKEVQPGQRVQITGVWQTHQKFGLQLKAHEIVAFELSDKEKAINMLSGASLPGVGPATAERIADHFQGRLEEIMNSEDASTRLAEVHKIGPKTAAKIKEAWDGTRGTRDAMKFLQDLGLPPRLVQRVMKRHGTNTQEKVSKDPYYAFRGIKGMDLRKAENIASRMELPGHESWGSRAVMAMIDVLNDKSRSFGHTYLPWKQLQEESLKHLQSSGMIWKGGDLTKCAEKAVTWENMIIETGELDKNCIGKTVTSSIPESKKVARSLSFYLKDRLKQVGDKRAVQLVDMFGTDIFDVLRSKKAVEKLKTVPGMTKMAAEKIKESWDKNFFKRPDWVSPSPSLRLKPKSEKTEDKKEDYEVDRPQIEILDSSRCYHPEMYQAEEIIAKELARLASAPPKIVKHNIANWIKKNEATECIKLSEGQKEAIMIASKAPIMILTGGPGCGKTYTTATIVKLWCAMKRETKLAAPTGRASQRLQEMAKKESSTIHRLLKYVAAGSSSKENRLQDDDEEDLEGNYHFNELNPLEADSVLVDEAAMLDVTLAAALLQALKAGTQLVLVGDVDQLPPVGPGTVLTAAIQSKMIPVVDLREIFRQAQQSQIVSAAHSIQQGIMPNLLTIPPSRLKEKEMKLESEANWVKASGQDGLEIQEMVKDVISNVVAQNNFDPVKDVQVLSPMRKGSAGVEPMNQQLQQLLNPQDSFQKPQIPKRKNQADSPVFRLGDRVIQTQNDYNLQVFNGDLGFVAGVNEEQRTLKVEYPETDLDKIIQGHQTKILEYGASNLWMLDLAWATTVHKAQGGESPVVVLMLSNAHKVLLTRRLLYTAVTRAKKLVVIVGHEAALKKAVEEIHGDARLSSLQERLTAYAKKNNVVEIAPKLYGTPTQGSAPIDISITDPNSIPQTLEKVEASENALNALQEPSNSEKYDPSLRLEPQNSNVISEPSQIRINNGMSQDQLSHSTNGNSSQMISSGRSKQDSKTRISNTKNIHFRNNSRYNRSNQPKSSTQLNGHSNEIMPEKVAAPGNSISAQNGFKSQPNLNAERDYRNSGPNYENAQQSTHQNQNGANSQDSNRHHQNGAASPIILNPSNLRKSRREDPDNFNQNEISPQVFRQNTGQISSVKSNAPIQGKGQSQLNGTPWQNQSQETQSQWRNQPQKEPQRSNGFNRPRTFGHAELMNDRRRRMR